MPFKSLTNALLKPTLQLLDNKQLTVMLKQFTFKLFSYLFFEYFVNIFLRLTTLKFTRRNGGYGGFI